MRRQYDPNRLAQFVAGPTEKEKAETLLFQSINMDMPSIPSHKEKLVASKKKEKKRPAGLKMADDVDVNDYEEKESLEEWMDNLQHRLDKACISSNDSPSGSLPSSGVPASPDSRQGRRTTAFPFPDVSSRNEDGKSADQNRLSVKAGKITNEGKGRWKSAINLSDSAVEFLTDSDYLGQLQGKIQKKSINILYERLAERQEKDREEKAPARHKGDGSKSKSSKKKKESSLSVEKNFFDE